MDIMSDDSTKSFHTAKEDPPLPEKNDSPPQADRKSVQSPDAPDAPDAPGAQNASNGLRSSHRRAQRLPYELRDHIRVFLEERMYGEAVQLLTSLLASGGSNQRCGDAQRLAASPLWVPPPSHLAVLATLAVHPAYTSRPQEGNDLRVAAHALQYLRHILAVAGPVQAEMASAFQFRDAQGRSVGRGRPSKKTEGANGANGTNLSGHGSRRGSGRGSGRNSARNSLGASLGGTGSAVGSTDASVAGSRSQSVRPRRRRLFAQSAHNSLNGGISSDYVDSGSIVFDDNGDALVDAVYAAADTMAIDSERNYGNNDNNDDDDAARGGNDSFAEDDDDAVGGRMATKDSVWVRGQDFWHVVAWAMACSVNEPARWRCWQPWLTLVVDVLEADFAECLEAAHGLAGGVNSAALYDSLLFQYLDSGTGSGGGSSSISNAQLRRIAQAILSDGSQPASLVREVFDKETVRVGTQTIAAQAAKPARTLDLDNNKFGDYSDDDESAPATPDSARSMSPTPFSRGGGKPQKPKQARRGGPSSSSGSGGLDQNTGYLESLPLRHRLLYLVMLGAVYLPSDFATADSVYRTVAEVLREGDIFVFSSFVAAPPPAMPPALASVSASMVSAAASSPAALAVPQPDDILAGLLRHILFTYLPGAAPKPYLVDRQACASASAAVSVASVSGPILERCFLPFAANTVLLGANVRMALTLESLFRLVWGADSRAGGGGGSGGDDDGNDGNDEEGSRPIPIPLWTPALAAAAEAGVKAREARVHASTAGRSRHAATEVEALGKDMLQRSGRRLLAMVQLARMDADDF